MPSQESADVNFFALVHHVLEASRHDLDSERRVNNRRQYARWQYIAPYRSARLPAASDFVERWCQDLSPSGFSYVSPEPPDAEHLIVALGHAPHLFVSAAVMHHRRREGCSDFLVGCQFVARVEAMRVKLGPSATPPPCV